LRESRDDRVAARSVFKVIELMILRPTEMSFASAVSNQSWLDVEPNTEAAWAFTDGWLNERRVGCTSSAGCVFAMSDELIFTRHS
jgi:hypothetical protein